LLNLNNALEFSKDYTIKTVDYWATHDLFTFYWWVHLFLLIVPWIIFYRIVDRKRIFEILLFGVLIGFLSLSMDVIGTILNFWEYKINLLPIVPWLSSVDFSVIPVFYMILYQSFRSWKSFIVVNVISASAFSFIAQPIVNWMGFVQPIIWEYAYSFPILLLMPLGLKLFLERLLK
jgi:hypothetical protein